MRRVARGPLGRISPTAKSYLLGSAGMGAAHAVPWTLLALYLDQRGFSKTDIGFVQSAESWGKVLVAIPAAFFLARRSSRPIFVGAALMAGACYFVLPMLESRAAVAACNLLAGLAWSLHYVAVAPFLYRHTETGTRAMVFGLSEAIRTLAAVAGAFLAGRVVQWAAPYFGSETEAMAQAIRWGGAGFTLLAALAYSRIKDTEPSIERGQPMLPVVRKHRGLILRFALPQFAIACGAGLCIPFLPLYFQDRFGFGPGAWGNLFACGQLLTTTGFLLTPLILRHMGFVRSMVMIEMASIPFFVILAFTGNAPLAIAAFLMRGALMNSTHPILKNFMMQATPPGVREVQTGLNATLWGIGWVVGPLIAGRVLTETNDDYSVLMLTTVGFYLLAAVLSVMLLMPLERDMKER
ncbi:MAG: putative MFS family arabinose efflux permease [Planctomycetota bacterium]|jgi:predicted MFS family arabinose efflux permease